MNKRTTIFANFIVGNIGKICTLGENEKSQEILKTCGFLGNVESISEK